MRTIILILVTSLFQGFVLPVQAQRLSDPNAIGWFCSLNTVHLNDKYALWLEYQWRRQDFVGTWQQSLARTGVQYQLAEGVSAMLGYAYVISYPFGDYPAGRYTVPEHRIFEQLVWNGQTGRLALNHRIRLEQRYLGSVDQQAPEYGVSNWTYMNRVRYQLRATLPLGGKEKQPGWYLAVYDEVFIGFGRQVRQNVFDQNRIGLLFGRQLSPKLRIEAGYLNQTVQQAGLVQQQEVFQYNNGFILNFYTDLKL